METQIQASEGGTIIRLSGRFDFNAHKEFRAAIDEVLAGGKSDQISIDLGGVSYIDSSALGMLLMLRDKAKSVERPVVLCAAHGSVKQVLDIANFGKLFSIV